MNLKLVESLVQTIESLSPDDYALFQQQLAIKSVQKTGGVCGGSARIRNTRIPVWTIVSFQRQGADEEELLRNFPVLTPFDLVAARTYYTVHFDEIDREILANGDRDDAKG